MKQRIKWIDIAKAICIFAVIIGHRGLENTGFLYSFHLTVFFILAGFTSKVRELNGTVLKNWFRQLMKPYFLTCFAVLCMELVNLIGFDRDFTVKAVTDLIGTDLKRFFFASGGMTIFGSIDMGRFIGAIWFLPAMFFGRVIFQLIINKLTDKRLQTVAAIGIALTAVAVSKVVWLPFSILPGMFAVPFMLVGYYAKETELFTKMKWQHYLLCAGLFVVGCLTEYAQAFYMVNVYAKDYFLTSVFALAGSFTVIGISKLLEKIPTGAFRFFGENSLIVLCVHLFEMNTFYNLYRRVFAAFNIAESKILWLVMELIVVIVLSFLMVKLKRRLEIRTITSIETKRDISVDIMRGFLIILMIICHVPTTWLFHRIVYSFHMIAFVIVSGYFFRSGERLGVQIKKCLKTLVYYGEFAVLYLFLNGRELAPMLRSLICGVSYTDKLFSSVSSVGPVYFILLLFTVRFIYIFIDRFFKGYAKDIAVLAVSLAGIYLGKSGYYLFWSLDCAMFCVLFFHIATYIRKYELLKKLQEMPYMYFVFSLCWFLFVYNGSMDLATRRYENIGILIVGSLSAFILVYQLCAYIMRHWPHFVTRLIAAVGESTAYILILHTLFSGRISAFVRDTLALNEENIFYLAVSVFIQISAGTIIYFTVQRIKGIIKKKPGNKKQTSIIAGT